MFEIAFKENLASLIDPTAVIELYWKEIADAYSSKNRHYHNLDHLNNLYQQLLPVKDNIRDWPIIIFSIAYHDLVYNSRKKDNEVKSAERAVERLQAIRINTDRIDHCKQQILATAGHLISDNSDVNYFTDADLSILGVSQSNYLDYASAIRKEYKMYPGFLYKPGRIKVLKYFLSLDRIFKTDHFHALYEVAARNNLAHEIQLLGG
ncbi:MAG TPA: hypothetical protein VHM26_03105 [Chitinophagaceae bacterium]|nr:hypothetical protein [Chitinophagaceae bacterium]